MGPYNKINYVDFDIQCDQQMEGENYFDQKTIQN